MLLPQLTRRENGEAMVLVMVGLAMVGSLAYYLMQVSDKMNFLHEKESADLDRSALLEEMRMILQAGKNCGLGPSVREFRKSQVHWPHRQRGLPFEFWTSHPESGERLGRKFRDNESYHDLKIISTGLYLDQGSEQDYTEGRGAELGTLRVKYAVPAMKTERFLDIPLTVKFKTGQGGLSMLEGCSLPAAPAVCAAVDLAYDPVSGQCLEGEECDDWLTVADPGPEMWTGENKGHCSDNVGSHLRDVKLFQEKDVAHETNGMKIKCCHPRSVASVRCLDFEDVSQADGWMGDVEAFCDMKALGYVQGLILSQSKEGNGLMIRCCYPH